MKHSRPWVLMVPLTVALLLAAPAPARADLDDWGDWGDGNSDDSAGIALAVMVSVVHSVYVFGDIGYAAKSRWLPPGWAWTQTLWGGLNVTAGLIMVPLGALAEDKAWLGLGLASGLIGTWFMVHGIISLVKHYARRHHRGPPPPPGFREDEEKRAPTLSLCPTKGGLYTGLTWRF